MLRLKNVTKIYRVGDMEINALKGITINFRKNEFVSILGPSGCGKTTLLNIIGGLDKYTSGDLIINSKSTKKYKDRDWDVYRNHRIGFIFQSYNLIPHQTILSNVELALTIGGVSKTERIEKAKKALDRVGLSGMYNKKPNQLSGGQCQRVAIARALVNEPEILLADEPTGALDTVTSIQIMDLIKEISKEKLVIMVTHNPDLATKYSTRIVKLLDGLISDDSNPCSDSEESSELVKTINVKEQAKMSFITAFKLSSRNLLSKFKRTLMVGFAGSIGIIGVSLVLALSSGINDYIDDLQQDMLSGNPITIEEQTYDVNSLMNSMTPEEKTGIVIKNGFIGINSILETFAKRAETMKSILVTNEITKEYVDYIKEMPKEYVEDITFRYGFDITNNIYTGFRVHSGDQEENVSLSRIKSVYKAALGDTEFASSSSLISTLSSPLSQSLSNDDYILSQYDLVTGRLASGKNEIVIVVNKDKLINDLTLAQLGYYTEEKFLNLAFKYFNEEKHNSSLDKNEFSYDELLGKKFIWYKNDLVFKEQTITLLKEARPFTYESIENNSWVDDEDKVELNVVGILMPKQNLNYGSLTTGFYYTKELSEHIIKNNIDSNIVKYIKDSGKNINSTNIGGMATGVVYDFSYIAYDDEGEVTRTTTGYVGTSSMASIMSGFMPGSSSGTTTPELYTITSRSLGGEDIPSRIAIYPKDFEIKKNVLSYLDAWNSDDSIELNQTTILKSSRADITYTDNLSLVIEMVSKMITIITTALVAFTAISLVVSTVMIGIITYVSVVERIKEIGVIRSLGGRKKDVAYLFNAETFIIGFVAGAMGVLITYLISIVANMIIGNITDIYTLLALKPYQAVIMVTISVLLTLISGLLPSRSAARMDPVNALRTE